MKIGIIVCLLFIAVAVSAEDFHDTVFVQFYQALDSLNHIKNEVTPATFEFDSLAIDELLKTPIYLIDDAENFLTDREGNLLWGD